VHAQLGREGVLGANGERAVVRCTTQRLMQQSDCEGPRGRRARGPPCRAAARTPVPTWSNGSSVPTAATLGPVRRARPGWTAAARVGHQGSPSLQSQARSPAMTGRRPAGRT
jgi:hypothetical protein